MSDAVQIQLILSIAGVATVILQQYFNHARLKRTEGKVDENIKLSNSMLSRTVAKKEAAEQKLETTHAETVAELKAKLAEKEATIALMSKVPGAEVKDSGEVRPFKPEVREGGLDR